MGWFSLKTVYILNKKTPIAFPCLLLFLLPLTSCLFSNRDQEDIIDQDSAQVYSDPYWKEPILDSKRYRRIVIAATNDTLGHISPQVEVIHNQDERKKLSYQVGGFPVLLRYLEILRKKFQDQVLFLDAGNIYRDTLTPQQDKGESMVEIYNQFNYDALTIGNHDLQFESIDSGGRIEDLNRDHQKQLKKNISLHKAPYVVSNIIDITSTDLIKWKKIKPYIIKTINGVKVAIIGGISSSAWRLIPKENLKGIYIRDLGKSLLKYSQLARAKGAEVIIALVHMEDSCGTDLMKKYNLNPYQVNFNPRSKKICNYNDEIFKIIDRLPRGTIHAMVSGGSQSKIANFFKGIPIIQSFSHGLFLGRIELFYDSVRKRVDIKKTRIYQPTKLCHQFFKSTRDCYNRGIWTEPFELIPATFLGEIVYPQSQLAEIVKRYDFKMLSELNQKIIEIRGWELSDLKNIIPYAVRRATGSQIAFTASTYIAHAPVRKKDSITYQDIYQVLPRDHYLAKVSISGKKLRELVEIATARVQTQPGKFSGLKVVLHKKFLLQRDLNKDGKKEAWERSWVKSIKLSNGEPIIDDNIYTLGTQAFFSENSAGNYSFIFSNISEDQKTTFSNKTNRRALLDLLRSLSRNQKRLKEIVQEEKNWAITI